MGCTKYKVVNCVSFPVPKKPEDVVWVKCTKEHACLNLENARKLFLHLAKVKRFNEHIRKMCNELDN